ncbi:MAG: hypothetical protein LWX23_07975 [Spirochaetia bacterium]|mgnify:FL=1|jgi:hypothetical protein|uniref:Uncharacterized protein n=2 Tax=root TaxID=1 RepID=A0A652ZWF3_9SPIR|nr:hypothetical protein [Spirochaetia bacterium]MCE1209392.1 hypothetical protein [Spirochaetia bacterium]VBB40070.1 hypothetical protein TRIP_E280047 [uncultured Spirochaetota bacterium]
MNTDNKKGILERWFKVKKRGCCDIKIEEIKEERENTRKPESGKKDGGTGDGRKPRKSCCG